jgi:CubicO group peptidase (beta-lactamase class C family)
MKYIICVALMSLGCKWTKIQPILNTEKNYFPENSTEVWASTKPEELAWKSAEIPALYAYLERKNTKAFMVLVDGRIVLEQYFNGHKSTDTGPWNSAGKTLVSSVVGIAEAEKLLQLTEPVSSYLGKSWTVAALEKENKIQVQHLLTMSSGLNDEQEWITKNSLTYVADAGSRWSYHNVFQRLMEVVSKAANRDFEDYFNLKIKNKIGMKGYWNMGLVYRIFHSDARSMAKFGLLALNNGKWNEERIIPEKFIKAATSGSQSINPAYGYLWWLNGQSSYMLPGSQKKYTGSLVPSAPADMFAAMGAADQRLYLIPSKNMVIVRMGEASDPKNLNFAASGFDEELWKEMNKVF